MAPKQLDEGIGDTLVFVGATRDIGRSTSAFIRLAIWAESAAMTDAQSRSVTRAKHAVTSVR
jgi:hypothetical protein